VLHGASDLVGRKPGLFSVQRCAACSLVATAPRPPDAELATYYENVYSGAGAKAAVAFQIGAAGRWVARSRLRALLRDVPLGRHSRVLEVGCGYGLLLAGLRHATGCEAVGIDTDAGTLAHACDRDHIDYRAGTLATADLPAQGFDAVLFFQSLEHHADPLDALRRAFALLKPGGRCVVEVPDFASPWRRLFGRWWFPLLVPQHLVHFEARTLEAALREAGFRPGRSRPRFYPFESTASLALLLNETLRRPLRRYRLQATRPDGVLLLAVVALWWLAVELPTQALLAVAGRTGHQWVTAQKPD
jgi:SAM-dependent methyltransferase